MPTNVADPLQVRALAALPPLLHRLLVRPPEAAPVAAVRITDPEWLREQIALRAEAWPTTDQHVLATLWWFAASHYLVTPTIATLLLTGRGASPALRNLVLHHFPDGTVSGAHSTDVRGADLDSVIDELRAMLVVAIDAVSAMTRHGVRPLWALATDGLADRLLSLGEMTGRGTQARTLAVRLSVGIGSPMLRPRYVQIASGWSVRRVSCCLLYRVPGQQLCRSCPRQLPAANRRLGRGDDLLNLSTFLTAGVTCS